MPDVPDEIPIIRAARLTDHAGIAALETAQGLKAKPVDEWRSLWTANPCYRELGPDFPIGWVLETKGGRIVGSFGNLPLPYVWRGQKLLVATGRGWAVEEKYRSFALMLIDEYFNQAGVDIFMNTTVNSNAAQAFGVFGSLPVPAGDWNTAAFFVTRKRAFAESALRIRKAPLARCLSYPVGVALSGYDWLRAPRRRAQGKAQISYNFDPRFDAFWRRLSQASPALLAVRSRALLDWHFAASLARNHLWIITVEKNGELEAYGILQRRDESQYGLTRMRLVDFQALKSHDEHCRTIVSAALHECATRGIQVLEHVGCGLNQTRILDEWAPHRRKLPSWAFFYKASNPALAERLAAPHAWQPSSYDGDSSL